MINDLESRIDGSIKFISNMAHIGLEYMSPGSSYMLQQAFQPTYYVAQNFLNRIKRN